jgi:xylose dehydrogenase (NAD/NADP)
LADEAFMYRFHPQIIKLKEMIDAGDAVTISAIRTSFRTGLQDLDDIRYQKELGGRALTDIGCYCVNIARLLTGREPTYVKGIARLNEQKGVDEGIAGIIRFAKSELGLFDCAFQSAYHQTFEVIGDIVTLELPAPFLPGD